MDDIERHAQWEEEMNRNLLRVHRGELSSGDFVMLYGWAPKAISIDDVIVLVDAVGDDASPETREAIVRIKAAIGGWDA